MKHCVKFILFFLGSILFAQNSLSEVLSLSEYLSYVKSNHPVVKQAGLVITESEVKLQKARGAFDPKFELDYDRKKFKETTYYDKLNAMFKIPVWYGIDFKAKYERNDGEYLNPESTLPEDGLYNVGVSISLAKGFLINERMASIKQAKIYQEQAEAERLLMVNTILYDASLAYFKWLKTYQEKKMYTNFLKNSHIRFKGVKRSYEMGDKPAVDTLESYIVVTNRKLNFKESEIKYIKASLELSNYLWLNDVPVEIQNTIIPDENTFEKKEDYFSSISDVESYTIEDHPKLRMLESKYKGLQIEKKLNLNQLLPKVDVHYNFLSESLGDMDLYTFSNYKSGITLSIPLFLRKERANLKLTKLKLQDLEWSMNTTKTTLGNKMESISREMENILEQERYATSMVADYATLLKAEERMFELGESSIFLMNSRESKLINSELKLITLQNKYLESRAHLESFLMLEYEE
ncbi:hypothetical protein UJ101_02597 [Flavobacteriaceae bacterium UJ101]|nr:hypothetical protein UJ101_02597 [Flavobacteriaceae bacterium UJ101]